MTTDMRNDGIDWPAQVVDQLDWHWRTQLRPRLEGLADDEYLWEPRPGAWNVRLAGDGAPATIDFAYPEPRPAPLTTIAWRLAHVIVGCFGARNASHFGGPAVDYATFPYARSADEALGQLDEGYARWLTGVRGWAAGGSMGVPVGPAEDPWAEHPRGTLVLHINREVIHHGAEIAVLRDLWTHRND
jgi:hypothetical protein